MDWQLDIIDFSEPKPRPQDPQGAVEEVLSTLNFVETGWTGGMGVFVRWYANGSQTLDWHDDTPHFYLRSPHKELLQTIKIRLPFETAEIRTVEATPVPFVFEGEAAGYFLTWPENDGLYRYLSVSPESDEKMLKSLSAAHSISGEFLKRGRKFKFEVIGSPKARVLELRNIKAA